MSELWQCRVSWHFTLNIFDPIQSLNSTDVVTIGWEWTSDGRPHPTFIPKKALNWSECAEIIGTTVKIARRQTWFWSKIFTTQSAGTLFYCICSVIVHSCWLGPSRWPVRFFVPFSQETMELHLNINRRQVNRTKRSDQGVDTKTGNLEQCLKITRIWHELRSDLEGKLQALTNDKTLLAGHSGEYKENVFQGHCTGEGSNHYLQIHATPQTLDNVPKLYE